MIKTSEMGPRTDENLPNEEPDKWIYENEQQRDVDAHMLTGHATAN